VVAAEPLEPLRLHRMVLREAVAVLEEAVDRESGAEEYRQWQPRIDCLPVMAVLFVVAALTQEDEK